MNTILSAFLNSWNGINPTVKAVLGTFSIAVAFVSYLNTVWSGVFSRIDALIAPATGGVCDFSPLGLVNYCFPLDTMLNLIIAYGILRLACASVRMVKSFIPTIS